MWLRRHWPKFVGFVLFVWTIGVRVVGWAGSIDLVISRSQDPGWVGVLISYLLNPPFWLDLLLIGSGLWLIWWDAKRPREPKELAHATGPQSGSLETEPVRTRLIVSDKTASEMPQQTVAVRPTDGLPVMSRSSAAAAPVRPAEPKSEVPNWEWSKLYGRSEDGKVIHLRFLPDSSEQRRDAVLLVVYGYKVLRGLDSVKVGTVHQEMRRLELEAPNARLFNRMQGFSHVMVTLADIDYGASAVEARYLKRIRLSEGGAYELTDHGTSIAKSRAYDLIERA